jgi:hypothetical protein
MLPEVDAALLAENEQLLQAHGLKPERVRARAHSLLHTHRLRDWYDFFDAYGE